MISFKINNKSYSVPASWHEFSYQLYLDYVKTVTQKDDLLKIVSVLSGLDYEFLKKHQVKGAENLIRCLHYLKDAPDLKTNSPAQVGQYKIPVNHKGEFNIQFESLAQFEDMRSTMKKIPKDGFIELLEAYPVFVAIYLQQIKDGGEYSYSKAMQMVPEVLKMPFPDVLVAGSFFLLKLRSLSSGTASNSPQPKKIQKRKKQDGRNSLKHTARTRK